MEIYFDLTTIIAGITITAIIGIVKQFLCMKKRTYTNYMNQQHMKNSIEDHETRIRHLEQICRKGNGV